MSLNKNQIIEIYDRNKINYDSIKEKCEFNFIDSDSVDISIIIPVKGRENFNIPLVKHLKNAMRFFNDKTYSITFVEHSEESTHKDLCRNEANHIWIKKNNNEFFNKCLAMNVGAIFSNKAKYYLFHDIDILVSNSFFSDLFDNLLKAKENSVLQSFAGRKVVMMNNEVTSMLLNDIIKIDDVNPGDISSPYSTPGAPGGSIFINRDTFIRLGGFDPEFFHSYSCEDAFFYHKAEIISGIQGCDNPVIEAYHMDHPRTNGRDNPDMHFQSTINIGFRSLSLDDKISFISHISNNINKELNERSI